jgi:O-antigen ligase
MITILIVLALILSVFCSLILCKQHIAVLLVVLASSQMSGQSHNVIYAVLLTAMLHFFYTFFSTKKSNPFWLISLLPLSYIFAILFIQPYKIDIYYYLGYLAALFVFAWVTLIKWDVEKIVKFLTVYGLYLILTGFIEKIVTDTLRIGASLTVPTAYAVVLVTVWAIWVINAYLHKIYSVRVILLGTFLVFLAIVFSGTRMGLIGIMIGCGLCGLSVIFMKNRNMSIIKTAAYSVSVIALLFFISIAVWKLLPNDLYIKKSFSTLIEGKLDKSNTGRVHLWVVALDIIEKNKLLGIGAGNFPDKCKIFFASFGIHKNFGMNTHAHNIYLIMLSEHGIIGFLILITFAFLCIFKLFLYFLKNRNSPVFYAFFAGFIIIAVLGFVDATPMYLPTAGFAAWFFGVCASFRREEEICQSQ